MCPCGKRLVVTGEEPELEMALVPESWIDNIAIKLESKNLTIHDYSDSFLLVQKTVYKCSNCYRYWFENENGTFNSYIPEYKCKDALLEINKETSVNNLPFWKRIFN